MKTKKIYIIGNAIVDKIKTINSYPEEGMLVNINTINDSIGGCLCNTSIDLKKLDENIEVFAFGKIGKDNEGKFILEKLNSANVDTTNIVIDEKNYTGFTDVMTNKNGNRTFFHYKGTNKTFSPSDINLNEFKTPCHVHLGYLMLLDAFDSYESEYGTEMAKFLHYLKSNGFTVSLDLVSEYSSRFKDVVLPSLKYCDYLIINEIESSMITDIKVRDDNKNLILSNLKNICLKISTLGNFKKIIIHCPELGIVYSNGEFTIVGSLILPENYIKGSVGAGDAFCAGCLYGILNNLNNKEILEVASCSAANNLASYDSISNAKNIKEVIKLNNLYRRRNFDEKK